MYGNTRVVLSLDEIITLRAAMSTEVRLFDRLIEAVGDPNGVQEKNKAMAEGLYEKLGMALERICEGRA